MRESVTNKTNKYAVKKSQMRIRQRSEIKNTDNQSKNILLIEDDEALAVLLARKLSRSYKCQVQIAYDSFSAMNFLSDNYYDVIILDWNLPGFDGGETLQRAERAMSLEPALPMRWDIGEVPVIVLSSSPKQKCQLKNSAHFSSVGHISKEQPLSSILSLIGSCLAYKKFEKSIAC